MILRLSFAIAIILGLIFVKYLPENRKNQAYNLIIISSVISIISEVMRG